MIYVDIPTESCFDDDAEGEYKNIRNFPTMAEAVKFLRYHLGESAVTDDGFVNLTMGADHVACDEVAIGGARMTIPNLIDSYARVIGQRDELASALQELLDACEHWDDQYDPVLVDARAALANCSGKAVCESAT